MALVFDLTNVASFQALNSHKEQFYEQVNDNIPFILVGNKKYLAAERQVRLSAQIPIPNPRILLSCCILGLCCEIDERKKVSDEEIQAWIEANGNPPYYQVSAQSEEDVEKLFDALARLSLSVMEAEEVEPSNVESSSSIEERSSRREGYEDI